MAVLIVDNLVKTFFFYVIVMFITKEPVNDICLGLLKLPIVKLVLI